MFNVMGILTTLWTAGIISVVSANVTEIAKCQYFEKNKEMYCGSAAIGHLTDDKYPVRNTETRRLILIFSKSISIEYNAFHKLKHLEKLLLTGNQIQTLDSRLFSYSYKLTEMYLNYNILQTLATSLFSNLTNLQLLDISYNKLTSLNDVVLFQSQGRLLELNLQDNNINMISEGVLKPLYSLNLLKLSNNPFNCTCEIQDTLLWTEEKCFNTQATCARPSKLQGKSWSYLGTESCEKPWNKVNNCLLKACNYLNAYKKIDCSNLDLGCFGKNCTPFNETEIVFLDLSHNGISTLQSDAFNLWPGLQFLILRENKLRVLIHDMFHSLINLIHLDLSFNELGYLDDRLFLSLSKLLTLYLSSNNINTLSEKLFHPTISLEVIYTNYNPLECDCQLQSVLKLFSKRNVWTEATCKTPSYYTGKSWTIIEEELDCYAISIGFILIIVAVIVICLSCLATCYFYVKRKRSSAVPNVNEYDDVHLKDDNYGTRTSTDIRNSDIEGIYSYPIFKHTNSTVEPVYAEPLQYDVVM